MEGSKASPNLSNSQNESSPFDNPELVHLREDFTRQDINANFSFLLRLSIVIYSNLMKLSNVLGDIKKEFETLKKNKNEGRPLTGEPFSQKVALFFNAYLPLFISFSAIAMFCNSCLQIYIQLKTNGFF